MQDSVTSEHRPAELFLSIILWIATIYLLSSELMVESILEAMSYRK